MLESSQKKETAMSDQEKLRPDDRQEKSNKVRQRLIWLGIGLAILAAVEIGNLALRIAHPSF